MKTPTILLDLDNTLLGNRMSDFLPPYFAALATCLQKFVDGRNLQQLMMASVQVMQANQDPAVTNMAAFMADFCQRIGQPAEALEPVLETFYREVYPTLQAYTTYRPEAPQVVRRLLADGCAVVIATNPLFPATAIEQRLRWAGVGDLPYALVTTMENSHFSKPDPRYYEEILTKVAAIPETTWMVGDDLKNDIAPAHALGMKTWWITGSSDSTQTQPRPTGPKQGPLANFLRWLESGGLYKE